jgi:uncharacterized alkaline shock family protein YloU
MNPDQLSEQAQNLSISRTSVISIAVVTLASYGGIAATRDATKLVKKIVKNRADRKAVKANNTPTA